MFLSKFFVGPLEIQIRSSSKSTSSSNNVITTNNVVKELENSLSDIVEIHDYLKIARSFPIVSLSFLKKLRVIKGNRLEGGKYSLIIWDNQNLEELWSENQQVKIDNGKLFFYFNPKLCFYKVERLAKTQAQIENYDTASKSNGKTFKSFNVMSKCLSKVFNSR
jgi:insulin receptor